MFRDGSPPATLLDVLLVDRAGDNLTMLVHWVVGVIIQIVELIVVGSFDGWIEFVELCTGELKVRHDRAGSLFVVTLRSFATV